MLAIKIFSVSCSLVCSQCSMVNCRNKEGRDKAPQLLDFEETDFWGS